MDDRALRAALPLLLLLGCEGIPVDPTKWEQGEREPTFVAEWAGEPWTGDAEVVLCTRGFWLFGVALEPTAGAEAANLPATLRIRVGESETGEHLLGDGDAELTYRAADGGEEARYRTTSQHGGYLVIVEATAARVWGLVSFDAAGSAGEQPAGELARFEGSFAAHVMPSPCKPRS